MSVFKSVLLAVVITSTTSVAVAAPTALEQLEEIKQMQADAKPTAMQQLQKIKQQQADVKPTAMQQVEKIKQMHADAQSLKLLEEHRMLREEKVSPKKSSVEKMQNSAKNTAQSLLSIFK